MVEELPENADTGDNLLALSHETQKCLVMLNTAECMFYSDPICLHVRLSVSLCVVLPSVACSFKHELFKATLLGYKINLYTIQQILQHTQLL